MPLNRMAILRGRPIRYLPAGEPSPHFQILVAANGVFFRAAVNARSFDKSLVQFLQKDITGHPYTSALRKFAGRDGLHLFERIFKTKDDQEAGALDYLRTGILSQSDVFQNIDFDSPGPNNDINERLAAFFYGLTAYGKARLYLIGQIWGPDTLQDEYFGYLPGAGIHDIHMNQGNPVETQFAKDNGVFQDGAIIVEFPKDDRAGFAEKWECIFIRFQSQSTNTDDQTGNPKES